jgi:hypothetical protein
MAATDELIGRNMIEDATFSALKRHLHDEQIVELIYVITQYRAHGMHFSRFEPTAELAADEATPTKSRSGDQYFYRRPAQVKT